MESSNVIEIKNRSIEHYLLIIFSLILKGHKEIILRSFGSVSGKTIDIANFITKEAVPNMFDMSIQNDISEESGFKTSKIEAILKVKNNE